LDRGVALQHRWFLPGAVLERADGAPVCADDSGLFATAWIELPAGEGRAVVLGHRRSELAFSRYSWERIAQPIDRFATEC
jgi:hypothetical protein